MSTQEIIAEVNGLTIKTNSIYKVRGKLDKSAPTGFQEEGVTKLPSEGISHSFECRYVITNSTSNTGVYDTGFYEESPCYAHMDIKEVQEVVKSLKKHIVDPYERIYGKGILSHKNEEFWSTDGRQTVSDGEMLSTSNPAQLLKLYISMRGFILTPKDKIGSPMFVNSQYVIEDKEDVRSKKEEKADLVMEVIAEFAALLKTNKSLLVGVLDYVNLAGITEDTSDSTIKSAFYEWINQSETNMQAFQDTVELAKNKKTKDIVLLYGKLKRAITKKVVDYTGGVISYQGRQLGGDLKTAAKNLNIKKDLQDVKLQIIEVE